MITSRKKTTTIAFVLVLTIAAMSTAFLPAVTNAQALTIETHSFLSVRPNPVGVNQEILVNTWISPCMHRNQSLSEYKVVLTKPDDTTYTVTIDPIGAENSAWFPYIPDQTGTWELQLIFEGELVPSQLITSYGGITYWTEETYYEPSSSPITELIVQQEAVPGAAPAVGLPDYWEYPISREYREWYAIAGGWLMSRYDASESNYNPYSRAPATAHILWTHPPLSGVGGLIGGEVPGAPMSWAYIGPRGVTPVSIGAQGYRVTSVSINAIMGGRAYESSGGNILCYDVRTGELLWTMPGSFNVAVQGTSPELMQIGSTFTKYNAWTGEETFTMTGAMSGTFVDPYVYSLQTFGSYGNQTRYLIKWTTDGRSTNFASRIIYNVTYPLSSINGIWKDVGYCVNSPRGDPAVPSTYTSGAFNTTTGALLWQTELGYDMDCFNPSDLVVADGKLMFATVGTMQYVALDVYTGDFEWRSDPGEYPWADFWAYNIATAYGMVYGLSYNGIYAFNVTNGERVWHYYAGDAGYETPYGTWPFFGSIVVADGKIYAQNTEHTPNVPYYRGLSLHCVDAFTGNGIWKITIPAGPSAVAEGVVTGVSAYDSIEYAFGKGPSATEVSVSESTIANGSYTWITGTVTDQSPAQPGTPCVSPESMPAWMEYLHTQQTCPTDVTGVPVELLAMRSDGSIIEIGTVTSNGQGYFSHKWTPPDEDFYTVTATFLGDGSYYSSWDLTHLVVGPAAQQPQAEEEPEVEAAPDYTLMLAGITVAVVVAIAIGIVNLYALRKRT